MRSNKRLLGAALTVAMAAGCSPTEEGTAVTPEAVAETHLELHCLEGTRTATAHVEPGHRVWVINEATDQYLFIDVQRGGRFAVGGANPREREAGGFIGVTGLPNHDETLVRVVAGEPEFNSRVPVWRNAANAITAFCAETGPVSQEGYFYEVPLFTPSRE